MPDTVLPSPSVSSATASAPRMGTPANDAAGWAGWAISSFTNKLTTATGDMITTSMGADQSSQPRSASVPPPIPTANKPPPPLASRSGMTLTKHSTVIPAIASPDTSTGFEDADDFADDWGGFGDDDNSKNNGTKSNKNKSLDEDEDPWASPAPTSTTSFEDKGEPDFAGWLAAQSKQKAKNPLPKGLAKASAAKPTAAKMSRPTVGARANTEWPRATPEKKVAVASKKEVKKVETTKAAEDEEEGWGDAW